MVRREEEADERPLGREHADSSCAFLAGASPVPASVGAPGSRPQVAGRDPDARAGRQKPARRREPCNGEQQRGPQHEVKPAASTELQWESRAAHFTAKATPKAPVPKRALGLPGVRGAARVEGNERNTRDPSARSPSGQGGSYKPKAKSSVVQRESEGSVVLLMAAQHNAAGGKAPCGGDVRGAGKREGMAGKTGPNSPDGRKPIDKVRQLQRTLWAAAKRSPERRFHALYDRMWRSDVLREAWKRVKGNKGAAGVDTQTIADVEQYGADRFLQEIGDALRDGTYRPSAVKRQYIPKADGKKRPLGIPTVRDRVAQMTAKLVLEPVFEADFKSTSYGFRPGRSATMALEALRKQAARGGNHVLDADIRDYFGSIDHEKLLKLVAKRVSDRRVLKLLKQWLEAGVMEDGRERRPTRGTPQGGVISPLLANIYLHALDAAWERHGAERGMLVRYADDLVVMCKTRLDVEWAEKRVEGILTRLGLEFHPEKTRRVNLSWGKQGFDFLGCHLRKCLSGPIWEKQKKRIYFLHRWPSQRSMKRMRERVKELTPRGACHEDPRDVIARLNPVLRGWGTYFRTGNATGKFNQIDGYVVRRLRKLRIQRKGRHLRPGEAAVWRKPYFEALGLRSLAGAVQYPEAA
jgi:RNA-directed DNA polymerase